tara:strand:- start:840 stop:3425 length:2586 start_codon:yes stop_codon:yes gene_type:complete
MATTITTLTSNFAASLPQKKGDPPNFGTVKSGRALAWDGVVDKLTIADANKDLIGMTTTSGNTSAQDNRTLVFWMKTSIGDAYQQIFFANAGGSSAGIGLFLSTSQKFVMETCPATGSPRDKLTSTDSYTLNEWIRVVAVWDAVNSSQTVYANGSLLETATYSQWSGDFTPGATIAIGALGTQWYFNGYLSDFQVWNDVWTLADVTNDYRHPEMLAHTFSGTSLTASNIKVWYPMTEGNPESPQTTIFDGSGDQNHATSVFYGDELFATDTPVSIGSREGTTVSGFTAINGALSNTTEDKLDGSNSLKFVASANGGYISTDTTSLVVGKTYYFKGYSHANSSGTNGHKIELLTGGNASISSSTYSNNAVSWISKEHTFVATHTTLRLRLFAESDEDIVYFDKFTLKEVGLSTTGHVEGQETIFQPAFVGQSRKMRMQVSSGPSILTPALSNLVDADFTISFWASYDGETSADWGGLGISNNYLTGATIASGRTLIGLTDGNYQQLSHSPVVPIDGSWHHYVLTYVKSTGVFIVYIDGSQNVTETNTTAIDNDHATANKIYMPQSASYNEGFIDECSVFNKTLSLAEVQELYNDGVPLDATTHSTSPSTGTNNLIGYWRNDGVVDWTDRSVNSNHGVISGTSNTIILPEGTTSGRDINGFFLTHPNKNYLSLDGVGTYISTSDADLFTFVNGGFSLECWFKIANTPPHTKYLIAKTAQDDADTSDNTEYGIFLDTNKKLFFRILDDSASAHIGAYWNTALDLNTWYHVVCTHTLGGTTSATCKLYITTADTIHSAVLTDVDSESANTYVAMENTTQPLTIGSRSDGIYLFDGLIDDVRVYNRELSLPEIKKNWKHGSGKHKD